MKIQENIPLAQYTTFKIGGPAKFFCVITNEDELIEAIRFAKERRLSTLIIGGGSNILISDSGYNGLVMKMEIKGMQFNHSKSGVITVSVGAGEIWDDFVENTVNKGLYGLENLSSIPGTVGASPIQNIGAYGAEVSDSIHTVRALDKRSMTFIELSNSDCRFSYRDSLFKQEKGRYIVTKVDFILSDEEEVNIEYKDLKDYFASRGITNPSLKEVRKAVIDIRKDKLPDWKKWGTAGSFFKNPLIPEEKFKELKNKYPELPGFPEPRGQVKVSLGWILDKVCNAKSISNGKAHVYEKQALVLVTVPGASSEEVFNLAHQLMSCVKEKTGIEIDSEVEWVN